MEFISRLKCAVASEKSMEFQYHTLSVTDLNKRKQSMRWQYISVSLGWSTALVITIIAAKMSGALLILYTGVVLVLLINTFMDYQLKAKKINKIIREKREQ